MDKNKNPWKGIVPYTDDADDLRKHPFAGRDREISDLMSIVDDNAISTLYGRSGNGKTSLLKAGLFQCARKNGYYPVWIRLDVNGEDYAQQIIDSISTISQPIKLECNASLDKNTGELHRLRNFFGYNYFYSHSDEEVTPLIVLDQFEEVLRQNDNRALFLLKQLRDTLHGGCLCDKVTPYTIAFRVLISIREDDLYLLEDVLDSNFLDELKMGRYRLRSMSKENAPKIVLVRPELLNGKDRDIIVEALMNKALQQGQISTMMLSLMCHWLYDHCGDECITLTDVERLGDNPMEQFFKESTSMLDTVQMKAICRESVGSDGRRLLIDAQRMTEILSQQQLTCLCEETSQLHIFQLSADKKHYELIHDRLAETVFMYRKNMEEEERTRRMEAENHRIKIQNDRLNRIRSMFLSEKANGSSNRYMAQMLALEALPIDLEHPDKPLIPEAEVALRMSFHNPYCPIQDFGESIACLMFTLDGEQVLSLEHNGIVRVWDIFSGVQLMMFDYGKKSVCNLSICKSGEKIVSVVSDGIVRMNLLDERRIVDFFSLYGRKPKAVSISPDGTTMAIGTEDGKVIFYTTEQQSFCTQMCFNAISALMFSPDGEEAIAIGDGCVAYCLVSTGKWEKIHIEGVPSVTCISCSSDGKYLMCGTENGEIVVIDNSTEKKDVIDIIECERAGCIINTLAISSDVNKIAYSVGGELAVMKCDSQFKWNPQKAKACGMEYYTEKSKLLGDEYSPKITSVAWSPDDKYVVWGNVEGMIFMYDTNAGPQKRIILKAASAMKALEYSPNGESIFCLSNHNTFRIIDVANGKILAREDKKKNAVGKEIQNIEGHICAVCNKNRHEVELFENDNSQAKYTFEYEGEMSTMVFNSNASIIAIAQRNGVVTCWDTENGRYLYNLEGYSSKYNTVLFSPKGGLVATTGVNGTVNICIEKTGDYYCALTTGSGYAISLAFSPDGSRLAVGMEDGKIIVWNIITKTMIDYFERDQDGCNARCMAFNPTGEYLTASYSDGLMIMWSCPNLKEIIGDVRKKLHLRSFTIEEKKKFFLEEDKSLAD